MLLAVVGGSHADTSALAAFSAALARRVAWETGLDARAREPESGESGSGCDVLVQTGLPDPFSRDAAVDLVLLLEGDGSGGTGLAWRDTLSTGSLPWARVLWAPGDSVTAAVNGSASSSHEAACGEALDTALTCALDATTPLLRRRARPGAGLFTRLARRDAEHAGWRWTCDSCDVPECEHALRVASRMDTEPTLR